VAQRHNVDRVCATLSIVYEAFANPCFIFGKGAKNARRPINEGGEHELQPVTHFGNNTDTRLEITA
jgi:hypothetical protein